MTAIDARAYLEKSIDNVEDLPDDLAWTNAEVLEMLTEAVGLFEQAHTPTASCPDVGTGFCVAHTPTDDERDELEVQDLATVIGNVVIDYEDTGPHSQRPITIRDTCADWPMEIAGEVQAAGFRRPVQGEPTDQIQLVDNRDPECVKAWPGCHT